MENGQRSSISLHVAQAEQLQQGLSRGIIIHLSWYTHSHAKTPPVSRRALAKFPETPRNGAYYTRYNLISSSLARENLSSAPFTPWEAEASEYPSYS